MESIKNGASKLFNMLGYKNDTNKVDTEIEINADIFLNKNEFINIFLSSVYKRILKYCWHKTILEKNNNFEKNILNDCFLKTRQNLGFISLLSEAIVKRKSEIWLYDKSLNIIEIQKYTQNYNTSEKKDYEIVIDFSKYREIQLLRQYASIYYDNIIELAKKGKINGALILKIATLTDKISLNEKEVASIQATSIQNGINNGKGAVIDSNSNIELLNADISAEIKQIYNIKQEISNILEGLPLNFLFGISTAGIGASGENDTDGLERSIGSFFDTFWKPYFDGLFKENIKMKIENWRQIANVRDIINIIDTTEYLDEENKKLITLDIFRSINILK